MAVHKFKAPVLLYARAVNEKWFVARGVLEMGDIALLRETFGKQGACTGRAEIFQATSIVNGVTNFTHVPADQ